jgi:hypothetical protein
MAHKKPEESRGGKKIFFFELTLQAHEKKCCRRMNLGLNRQRLLALDSGPLLAGVPWGQRFALGT